VRGRVEDVDVLVAYSTAGGSTREVAERVGARLRERGAVAEVLPAEAADDLARYDALVLGSAVHSQEWLPAAARLLRRCADEASDTPVWLFSVSSIGETSSAVAAPVSRLLHRWGREPRTVTAARSRLSPRDHRSFAGVVTATDWPAWGRVLFRLMGGRFGDHRDWEDVDAWATGIAAALAAAGTTR
jgi:menaquinone-dependent protoporphyrinogen oxidase